MSNYSVTVAAGAEDAELVVEAVTMLLAPFEADREVAQRYDKETRDWHWYNPQAVWDWHQIGGRFSAELPLLGAEAAPTTRSPGNAAGRTRTGTWIPPAPTVLGCGR